MSDSAMFWDDPDEPPAKKPAQEVLYNFPLRDDFTAQLVLPRDLTTEEARRIRTMLITLAVD